MFKLKSTKHLILAIFDFLIIGVVIYGLTDWVYDGYPSWIPYAIIAFFFIMASVRFYKFSSSLKKSSSVDSHDIETLFSEESKSDEEEPAVSENGFRRRSKAPVLTESKLPTESESETEMEKSDN